jgi:hypothetical protein
VKKWTIKKDNFKNNPLKHLMSRDDGKIASFFKLDGAQTNKL